MAPRVESGIRSYGGFPAALEVSDVSSELEDQMKIETFWCFGCGRGTVITDAIYFGEAYRCWICTLPTEPETVA